MGEVIVITSGKGGVGKTVAAAGIGTGLAALGKKIVLVDMNIGLRGLDVILGLENQIFYNFVDVINEKCQLQEALVRDSRYPELFLLSTPQTKDESAVTPEQVSVLTAQLKQEFDFVILDCPPGIGRGFQNAAAGADRAIVVTIPEVSAIRGADRVTGLLERGGIRGNLLIVNRISTDMMSGGSQIALEDIKDLLTAELIGTIPEDGQIAASSGRGEPLSGADSPAEAEYRNICRRLLGEEIPFIEIRQKKGVFRKLGDIFRK